MKPTLVSIDTKTKIMRRYEGRQLVDMALVESEITPAKVDAMREMPDMLDVVTTDPEVA